MNATGFDDLQDDDMRDGPAEAAPIIESPTLYRTKCGKCGGSGRYNAPSSHGYSCFKCKGRGYFEFKTSPEVRASAKTATNARKAAKAAAAVTAWTAAHPDESAWLEANKDKSAFASSLLQNLGKYGSLTPAQTGAITRSIARAIEAKAAAIVRTAEAPVVDMGAIEAAFAKATARGLKRPKMRFDGFVVSPAKATSTNAGALYVKTTDGEYLGKVLGGKFLRVRDCTNEQADKLVAACIDPLKAAKDYARLTGACSVCGRTLTDPASVEAGIGPVCAEGFGF